MNMSRKEVVVSNVSKEHDNPIAELVQVVKSVKIKNCTDRKYILKFKSV